MVGYLILNKFRLGEIDFKVIDETMGVIGGRLNAYSEYLKVKDQFQTVCEKKGVVNSDDFDFIINLPNVTDIRHGIGITDLHGFEEIEVEVVGISQEILQIIKQ